MTVRQASDVLGISPQALRVALQREQLKEFGCAFRNKSDTGWRYIINEQAVLKFKGEQV